MVLLACCGGGAMLLPALVLLVVSLFVVKVAGYYFVGRALVEAHPELGHGAGELMTARVGLGLGGVMVATSVGALGGSLAIGIMALVMARAFIWLSFERYFLVPRVPLAAHEQVGWAVVGTLWSFLLDAGAAAIAWAVVVAIL